MNRQSWRCDEDQAICKLVAQYGLNDWTKIAEKLKQTNFIAKRTGKQCRERWYNHLNPAVNKKPWDNQQQTLLFQLHKAHGNRWKEISCFFVGRTDNDIKNHFYSTLRRSLRRLNKISGQKNSTSQMRQIKPSVLSTIMSYIYDQQHIMEKDLLLSLQDLPTLIFQYANFKPIKNNLKSNPRDNSRFKILQIFELINKFKQPPHNNSDQYEKNKQVKHQQKINKRYHHRKQSPDITSLHESSSNNQYQLQGQSQSKLKNSQKNVQQLEQNADGSIIDKQEEDNIQYDSLDEQREVQHNYQELECQNIERSMHLKRNLSLEQEDISQQAEMPSLIGPDRYILQGQQQGGTQLDLTIVGHRWQPQSWETEMQMKQFIDQVLEMNYDMV